jgi:hypothetical protein
VVHCASVVHVVGHVEATPSQTKPAHAGSAVVSLEHVPLTVPPARTEHASHAPVHAVPQQRPSTQKFEMHWLIAVQVPPLPFFPMHS